MTLYSFSQKCLKYILLSRREVLLFSKISVSRGTHTLQKVWHILKFLCYSCYNSGAHELPFQQTGIFSAAESWWPVRELKCTSGLQADWLCFSKDTFICRYKHGNSVRMIWLGLCSDHEWRHADVYSKEPLASYKHPTCSTFVFLLFHSVAPLPVSHPTAISFSVTDRRSFHFYIWVDLTSSMCTLFTNNNLV